MQPLNPYITQSEEEYIPIHPSLHPETVALVTPVDNFESAGAPRLFRKTIVKEWVTGYSKSAFFVLGAPTSKMFDELKKFHSNCNDKGTRMEIIFCAILGTFVKSIKNVYELPTNCRTHADGTYVKMGDHRIDNVDGFRRAQLDTSSTLCNMLQYADALNIPVYFAPVQRKKRPTLLVNNDDKGIAECPLNKMSGKYEMENVEIDLSNKLKKKFVLPAYGNEDNIYNALNTYTSDTRAKGSEKANHATFLVDMSTVACAVIVGDVWDRHELVSSSVALAKYESNSKTFFKENVDNVAYCAAKFDKQEYGNVYAFKEDDESISALKKTLHELCDDGGPKKIWEDAYVWHDVLLNDIDDLPAIELVKSLTLNDIETQANYDRIFQFTRQYPDKYRKFVKGRLDEKSQMIVDPRIDPTVMITAYHKFFGITGGIVNESTGYAVLLPVTKRKNGFEKDQVSLFRKEFVIIRNAAGRGGTPRVKDGEAGSQVDGNKKSFFKTSGGSMSYRHEFIVPLDTSFYWCNAALFGSGPGKYDKAGTLEMLGNMKKVALEWAKNRKIKKPFFGFHEFPNNSLFHLHLHMIDLDQIHDTVTKKELPGYTENFEKTISIDDYIEKLEK
jgi:hypothetical protein